ncbi:hypothetical protein LB103_22715 [Klebsiella aerogenes]|nr:hypothetical protein [Klebsiella aerogenes]MCY4767007.1 hypothetical protein [Klebsiella aerogenes]
MKKTCYTEGQISFALKQAETGTRTRTRTRTRTGKVCRKMGIMPSNVGGFVDVEKAANVFVRN